MRKIAATLMAVVLASPAYATQCPALWRQVSDHMNRLHLSEADQARLTELRAAADSYHHQGKHAEAEAALTQALALFAPRDQPEGQAPEGAGPT